VAHRNPQLSFSEVTSVLGRMWRGLTQAQKSEYIDLAKSVGGTYFGDDVPPPSIGGYSSGSQSGGEQCPVVIQMHVEAPDDPVYSIIPRGTSGWFAATASRTLLRREHQRYRTEQPPPSESLGGSRTPTLLSGSYALAE
jgi:hypothetical protein